MHIKGKDNWLKHFDFILIDIIVLSISFLLANVIYLHRFDYYQSSLYTNVFLCMLIPCVLIDILYSPFSGILRRNTTSEISNAAEYTLYKFVFAIFLMYVFKLGNLFSRVTFVLTFVLFFVFVILARVIWKKLLISGRIKLFNGINSLLIISTENEIKQVLSNINKEEYHQYEIKGLCLINQKGKQKALRGYPILCNVNEIYDCVINNYISEVFIATDPKKVDSKIR